MSTRKVVQVSAAVAAVVLAGLFIQTVGCSKEESPATGTTAVNAKCVNTVCPMMGMTFDPMKVPDNRIRKFNDVKVGFCSDDCPVEWDKLSDADKKAKLDKVMPK